MIVTKAQEDFGNWSKSTNIISLIYKTVSISDKKGAIIGNKKDINKQAFNFLLHTFFVETLV